MLATQSCAVLASYEIMKVRARSIAMQITRRDLLQTSAGLAAAAACALPIAPALADSNRIRPEIGTRAGQRMLDSYRRAVALLNGTRAGTRPGLPANDKRRWVNLAEIHFTHCPHGNWFFLPWHRAYLLNFEQICREVLGEPNFMLPYWDWSKSRQIPREFWGATSALDPARWKNRDPAVNGTAWRRAGQTTTLPASTTRANVNRILSTQNFETFASGRAARQRDTGTKGILESGPHDLVHRTIGGHMQRNHSPLDPIFWLHHANVDRLWATWNQTNRNTTAAGWLNYEFTSNFVDGRGAVVARETVSRMASLANLGYTYDTIGTVLVAGLPPGGGTRSLRSLEADAAPASPSIVAAAQTDVAFGRATGVTVPLGATSLEQPVTRSFGQGSAARQFTLVLADVTPPHENGDFLVNVFINTPDAGPGTTERAPGYVASFSFFGADHHGGGKLGFQFDITQPLQLLQRAGSLQPGALTVQLVPLPIDGRAIDAAQAKFTIGRIELSSD
jgi:tyrosinase